MDLYKQDGVDIERGDDLSSYAAKVIESTYHHSQFVQIVDYSRGHFRGPRTFILQNLPSGWVLDIAPDGVGTATGIFVAAGNIFDVGCNALAMTGGDIIRWGGMSVLFSNVLDTRMIGKKNDPVNTNFRLLFNGLAYWASKAGVVLFKGETAELGEFVGSDTDLAMKFNWSGFMLGVQHPDHMIMGEALRPGQIVVALRERGFRSNGFSSVRRAFLQRYGECWWKNHRAIDDIREAARPAVLYDHLLPAVNGWFSPSFKPLMPVHSIVHITGGGIPSKFGKDILFPLGLSADLSDLWLPPPIMQKCADWRGMDARECYMVWNGGQGMLVVLDKENVDRFVELALLHGIAAKQAGKIVLEAEPTLKIRSKFSGGEELTFTAKEPSL